MTPRKARPPVPAIALAESDAAAALAMGATFFRENVMPDLRSIRIKGKTRRQQAGDDDPDKLRARIAELEAQVAHPLDSATPLDPGAEPEDASAVRSATPQQAHELLAKQLHDAQSEWITLRGPGGQTMAKQRRSAHAELDELHRQTADARVLYRELQAQMDAANLKVEQAGAAIADAYAAENQRAVTASRKGEEEAVAEVKELQHRLAGALLRVERAQVEADAFAREHARRLLSEREEPARTVAADLTAGVRETLRLARAYVAERQTQDVLVAAVPGATPRSDGPLPSTSGRPR